MIAYIRSQRLYLNIDGQEQEHRSPFVDQKIADAERNAAVGGWKNRSSGPQAGHPFAGGSMVWGGQARQRSINDYHFIDVCQRGDLLYYLVAFNDIVGFFRYDCSTKQERRFFHKNDLPVLDVDVAPDGAAFVFAIREDDGSANLYLADEHGRIETQLTSGDTLDRFPRFTDDGRILYASGPIGRDQLGDFCERGPYVINAMSTDGSTGEELAAREGADLLCPMRTPDGRLLCLRKPWRSLNHRPMGETLTGILLFPYHLARALIGFCQAFINLFGQRDYSIVGHQQRQAHRPWLHLHGEMIRMKAAKDATLNMPSDWELYDLTNDRQLAAGVSSYALHGERCIYSDGSRCHQLDGAPLCQVAGRDIIAKLGS